MMATSAPQQGHHVLLFQAGHGLTLRCSYCSMELGLCRFFVGDWRTGYLDTFLLDHCHGEDRALVERDPFPSEVAK